MNNSTRICLRRSRRKCTKCGEFIGVGKNKIGRVVFKGGVCYNCWKGDGKPGKAKK